MNQHGILKQARSFIAAPRLSTWQSLLIIGVLSIMIKLAYIFALGGGLNSFPTEGSDVLFYDQAATNLIDWGVYGIAPTNPTMAMPPGQSYFLALLYRVSNHSIAFTKLAHVMLLTLVAVVTFFTAKELVNASVGFWTGVLIAIDPAQAYLAGTFLSEPLYIFFTMLAIYLLVRRKTDIPLSLLIAAGVCLGLAGLTRNQGWLFAFALAFGALLTRGRLMPIRAAAILLLASVMTIAPWLWRNYTVSGQLVLVAANGGLNLWSGNNPEFVFRQPMPMSLPIYDVPKGLSEIGVDQYYRQRAVDWIVSHPVDFVINGLRKVFVLYNFDPQSSRPEIAGFYRLAGMLPYGILLPFILGGLFTALRKEAFGIILWYVLFTTVLAFLFYGDSRIRAPIQPYLYIFGVVGVQAFAAWLNAHTRRELEITR